MRIQFHGSKSAQALNSRRPPQPRELTPPWVGRPSPRSADAKLPLVPGTLTLAPIVVSQATFPQILLSQSAPRVVAPPFVGRPSPRSAYAKLPLAPGTPTLAPIVVGQATFPQVGWRNLPLARLTLILSSIFPPKKLRKRPPGGTFRVAKNGTGFVFGP